MSTVTDTEAAAVQSKPQRVRRKRSQWRDGRYLSIVAILLYFGLLAGISEQGFGLLRPIKFPSPRMVVDAAIRLHDIILFDVLVTLLRVAVGFCAGMLLGIGLGLAML